MNRDPIPLPTILLVLLLAMLWGANVVALKISLAGLPPFAAAAIRFAVALPVIALWACVRGISLRPRDAELRSMVVIALLFVIQIALLNWGTNLTLAGRATVLLHIYPVCVAFLSHFMIAGDRLNWKRALGVFGGFAGIVVVFWEKLSFGIGGHAAGDLLCLVSGIVLGLLTVLIKRTLQATDAPRLLVWQMIIGVPLFFLLHVLFERGSALQFKADVVSAIAFQALAVAVFCFLTWFSILKRYSPGRLIVLFFTGPLWGLLYSYLLLGETITVGLVVGAGMVALGIFLVNRG
jgi:drug/metabolite transporter (DMT)-like permease